MTDTVQTMLELADECDRIANYPIEQMPIYQAQGKLKEAAAALRSPAIGTPDDAREALADFTMKKIWSEWFQFYQKHFRTASVGISAADQMAFYEIAQPLLRALAALPREQEVKPVAWRWKSRQLTNWHYSENEPDLDDPCVAIVESLYAAPPSDSPGSARQPQGGDAREAALEEAAKLLDEAAQDYNRIRDPGMANNARSYAKKIRVLKSATPPAPVRAAAEPGEMRAILKKVEYALTKDSLTASEHVLDALIIVRRALSPASANEGSRG